MGFQYQTDRSTSSLPASGYIQDVCNVPLATCSVGTSNNTPTYIPAHIPTRTHTHTHIHTSVMQCLFAWTFRSWLLVQTWCVLPLVLTYYLPRRGWGGLSLKQRLWLGAPSNPKWASFPDFYFPERDVKSNKNTLCNPYNNCITKQRKQAFQIVARAFLRGIVPAACLSARTEKSPVSIGRFSSQIITI